MSASRSSRWTEPGRIPKAMAALDRLASDHSRGGTVAIVEDDPDIASVLQLHLEEASYRVRVAHDGRGGLQIAHRELVDLVVLDLVLPDLDGLEVCRSFALRVPRPLILILSSRATEMDRVRGLNVGADDYLVKPFSVLEFLARVRALFRRPPLSKAASRGTAARCRAYGLRRRPNPGSMAALRPAAWRADRVDRLRIRLAFVVGAPPAPDF